jgi:hypothetical protein
MRCGSSRCCLDWATPFHERKSRNKAVAKASHLRRDQEPYCTGNKGVPQPTRVVITDDHAATDDGEVCWLLGYDVEVVGQAATGDETLESVHPLYSVVVLIGSPGYRMQHHRAHAEHRSPGYRPMHFLTGTGMPRRSAAAMETARWQVAGAHRHSRVPTAG